MQSALTPRSAFTPEQVGDLVQAFGLTLVEMRGRPEWRRQLGKGELADIAARAITSAAKDGYVGTSTLKDIALRAVRVAYLRDLQ